MLSEITPSEDRFKETGITRGMVNRMIPEWNNAMAIGILSRALDHVRDDINAVHILSHHISYLRGWAKDWQCPGNCNGYIWLNGE